MAEDTTPKTIADADIKIVDEGQIPSIYIDGMQGILDTGPTCRVGLYEYRQKLPPDAGAPAQIQKVLVGRLIFPSVALKGIAQWLAEHAAKVEAAKQSQNKAG